MSKARWRFTPAELKRLIRTAKEMGLGVTQVRVAEDGITLNTQPIDAQPTDKTDEWKVA